MGKIYVVVSGGCVQDVLDKDANPSVEYSLIDWDCLEGCECPVCQEELDLDDKEEICPKCGLHWGKEDSKEAVKCLQNWRNWE